MAKVLIIDESPDWWKPFENELENITVSRYCSPKKT
jgi:hypothetical protein